MPTILAALDLTFSLPFNVTGQLVVALFALVVIIYAGLRIGRGKAVTAQQAGKRLHSTPDYYGWFVVSVMLVSAFGVTVAALIGQIAGWVLVDVPFYLLVWVAVPLLLAAPAVLMVKPELRARVHVERVIYAVLFSAASISIMTTIAILLSVLFESIRFFNQVSIWEFLTGTTWNPGSAFKESAGRGEEQSLRAYFGSLPLFAGTFLITAIAMAVAVPVGLFSAIFLSEYASPKVRKVSKPVLEILAGIPTVVYGFFAAVTVGPLLANWIKGNVPGMEPPPEMALVPGLVMGIMIIPFMSSLCDDVISSVPQALRRASLAMGATKSECIKTVVVPAAMPGIVSAFLLAVSRAIGETMIVVMAAGLTANLTANPFDQATTVTVQIVASLTGDLAYDNPQTLSAFSLGLVLLIMTLVLNLISSIVIQRFRKRYAGM